jgi:predicted secreted protein
MTISASIVLYAVVWFMTLFVILPLRLKSQEEAGDVVPGTPASAPANPQIKKRMTIVTLVGTAVWIAICTLIITDILSMENLGFPPSHY